MTSNGFMQNKEEKMIQIYKNSRKIIITIEGVIYLAIHSFLLNDMERVKIRSKKRKFELRIDLRNFQQIVTSNFSISTA